MNCARTAGVTASFRSRGAAALELVLVLLLALLPMTLGILQVALLLNAHHTLNLATLLAVRAGTMSQADSGAMRTRLAAVLAASYLPIDRNPARDGAAMLQAQARAFVDLQTYGELRILRPTRAMLTDFGVVRDGVRVLPNDALQARSHAKGAASDVSLQDANVLEARVTWCVPLLVPLAGPALADLLATLDADPLHQWCYADRRVPLVSRVALPMQTDVLEANLP